MVTVTELVDHQLNALLPSFTAFTSLPAKLVYHYPKTLGGRGSSRRGTSTALSEPLKEAVRPFVATSFLESARFTFDAEGEERERGKESRKIQELRGRTFTISNPRLVCPRCEGYSGYINEATGWAKLIEERSHQINYS